MNIFKTRIVDTLIGAVIGGLIVWGVSSSIAYWMNKIHPHKIIAYLPYANDYFYANDKTYKRASPAPAQNMPRDIDPKEPIPLRLSNEQQKLTIGVRNDNSRTIDNVRIFLDIPYDIEVKECEPWTKYSDTTYYIGLGNIDSGVGHNAIQPVYFKLLKGAKKYTITYSIVGRNFKPIRKRPITFEAY